ncbi:Uncharacterized protein TCM_036698 [Theobroma cacao]|uniref:Reverse transcriptase zinc-binding domain-containing protein n=1 Tax=Theobroma cacao TaxID=3641 RepID=A0A061FSI9_THECC|nr:Uncharacterized protein TCM_036698 [Theobroma cacao]
MAYSSMSMHDASNSSRNMMGFWKRIWHLNIPRKVILFLWKAINDILLTRQALTQRLDISFIPHDGEKKDKRNCECPLWDFWKARNMKIFKNKSYEPLQVIEFVTTRYSLRARDNRRGVR